MRGSATIKINKVVQNAPAGDTTSFSYSTTGALTPSTFSLQGGGSRTYSALVPGSYSVSDAAQVAPWDFVSLTCTAAGGATYCATKHAVVGLSEAIRAEMRKTDIDVSIVMPVVVNTELGSGLQKTRGVKVVEPLKRHRLTYADAARKNRVEIDYEAVSPPVMFADGNHFEQAMRGRGTLTLRGATFAVDCYTLRDRSWGKPRPEDSLPLPAASWTQGIFGDDLAFSANIFDQADTKYQLWAVPVSLRARKKAQRNMARAASAKDPNSVGNLSTRAATDQVMDELRELKEARSTEPTAQGEPAVRWAYEIIAPALVGAVLLVVLVATG